MEIIQPVMMATTGLPGLVDEVIGGRGELRPTFGPKCRSFEA